MTLMENSILNLRWRQHGLEITTLLDDVRRKGLYSDAIISCENQEYPVHTALLSISSDFFAQIFKERCCENPFIVIKDVLPLHLEKLLIYIYSGEVSIHQDEVSKFLELARSLQIKGTPFTYGDSYAISATATNSPEARMTANNQIVEQLKITNKISSISKIPLSNFIRKDDSSQSILKEYISNTDIQTATVIRKDNVKINSSDHRPSPGEAIPPRCSATPSLPMDLTLNTMTSSASPPIVSQSLSLSSSSSSLSSSSSSSLTSLSQLSQSKSSLSALPTLEVAGHLPSLPSTNSVVNVVKAGVTAPRATFAPHTVILPFETLIKEEPKDSEENSGSEDVNRNFAHESTDTKYKGGAYNAGACSSEKKVLRAIPPMIPLISRSEETSHRQEKILSNKIHPNYMPDTEAYINGELNRAVSTCPPNDNITPSAPSRPPGPPPPPDLIPSSSADSRVSLNSSPYSRTSDEDCSESDYPEDDYTNSSPDKAWYVYPHSEAGIEKHSQIPYSLPNLHADGSNYNQHHKKSTNIMKDLYPMNQASRTENSTEITPLIPRDTALSHRNPRLLVNALPAGPSRYNSRLLGSNKNTSIQVPSSFMRNEKIIISKRDVPESQKVSMHTVSLGTTQVSSVYRTPLSSTTSQIGVNDDLKGPKWKLNTHSLDSSQDKANFSAISTLKPVSLSSKEHSSMKLSESDSDFAHEDGPTFSDAPLNIPFSFHSSFSNTQPSSTYHNYSSLPSTSRDSIEKSEEYSLDQNTIGNYAAFSKNEKSEDPCLQKVPSNAHRRRFRGPKAWEFLARLLKDPSTYGNLIRWEDEKQMVFRLVNPNEVARRWGSRQVKNSKSRSYHNFARSLRYHYSTGALEAVSERQLVYKFGPKAIKVLQEYDNIFPKTGGMPRITSQTGSDLVRIEREHYDTNPELSGKTASVESHSIVNPSLQFQTQTETPSLNPADSKTNTNANIISHPGIDSLNYGITYRTPSGNILPVPNIPPVPFPKVTSSQHGSLCGVTTTTSSMNVPHHPVNIVSRNTNLSPIGKDVSTSISPLSTKALPSFSNIKPVVTKATFSNVPVFKPISAIRVPNESTKISATSKIICHNELKNTSPVVNKETVCPGSTHTGYDNDRDDKPLVNNSGIKSKEFHKADSNSFKIFKPIPNLTTIPESSANLNIVSSNRNFTTLEHKKTLKTLVTSTPVSESITMPKFIPNLKSHFNSTSIPSPQSPCDKDLTINTEPEDKSNTIASMDNPEKECDDISSKNYTKSISIGQKHKLEENGKPVDFKRRWKNNYQP